MSWQCHSDWQQPQVSSLQHDGPHHTWYVALGLRGILNSLPSKQHLLGGCQQQQRVCVLQLGQVLHRPHRWHVTGPGRHRGFPTASCPRGWATTRRGLILSPGLHEQPSPSHLLPAPPLCELGCCLTPKYLCSGVEHLSQSSHLD